MMCTIGSRVGRGVVGPCGGTVVGIVVVTSSRIMVGGSEEVTIVGTDVVGSLVAIIGVRVGKELEDALGIPVGNDIVDGARLGDDEEEDDDSVGAKDGNEENDDDDGEELLIIVGDDGNEDAFVDNDDVGKGEPTSVDSSEEGSNDKLGAADGNIDTSDVSASVALLSSVKDDDEGG